MNPCNILSAVGNKHDRLITVFNHFGKNRHIDTLNSHVLGIGHGHDKIHMIEFVYQPGKVACILKQGLAPLARINIKRKNRVRACAVERVFIFHHHCRIAKLIV